MAQNTSQSSRAPTSHPYLPSALLIDLSEDPPEPPPRGLILTALPYQPCFSQALKFMRKGKK